MMMPGMYWFTEGGGPIVWSQCGGDEVDEMIEMGYVHGGVTGKM